MSETLQYLPCAGYTSMPWRNGAGVTREIARMPSRGEPFAWRLSLASIAASGPFSAYPSYQRIVALVQGRGFRLDIKDAPTQMLAACGEHALFAGAAVTECTLLDGPCTDLSLMVREPGRIASVRRQAVGAAETPVVPAAPIQVVFVLRGSVSFHAQSGIAAPQASLLHLNDTLIIRGGEKCAFRSVTAGDASELLLLAFTAAPDVTK